MQLTLKTNAHIAYFRRCLQALPAQATSQDANRITIAYFCLSGLDLLDSPLDHNPDWIWSLQAPAGGFRGSPFMTTDNPLTSPGHLPSTYTAVLTLALLRAPLDQLDVPSLSAFLQSCQRPDGSFSPLPNTPGDFQADLRMTYCASVISSISGATFNTDSALSFISQCRTWDGGYSARPGLEAQGGTTYCATASLSLLSRPITSPRWLLQRQIGGFQGRPGKLEDVCYSFWCGAALAISHHHDLVNPADITFLLSAQSPLGGFGKEPEEYPDPFHSYLALAALALHGRLKPLHPQWNVSQATADWLKAEIERIHGL